MRLIGAIVSLLVAAFFALGAVANFVPSHVTVSGIPEIGVKAQRLSISDPGRGIIFVALAGVFLVFAVLALRSHLAHRRQHRSGVPG